MGLEWDGISSAARMITLHLVRARDFLLAGQPPLPANACGVRTECGALCCVGFTRWLRGGSGCYGVGGILMLPIGNQPRCVLFCLFYVARFFGPSDCIW